MPKGYSGKEVIKRLKKFGFVKVSQKGSHIKMKGVVEGHIRTVIIPDHKQIAVGTLSSILRQANVGKQEFEVS
jgi:predicted RNA binding protein YcfA (HicA-like mRNA interferase family)